MERNTSNELVNTFEYSFPLCDDADESGGDSSKSTPYYTPLDFFQSSFDFPATVNAAEKVATPTPTPTTTTPTPPATAAAQLKEFLSSDHQTTSGSQIQSLDVTKSPAPSRHIGQSGIKQGITSTSPAVSRKLRRFSLYERSCSPQHLLIKNTAGSVDYTANDLPSPVDDKENAKPLQFFEQARDELVQAITRSGNSSPIILKDDSASPKIPTSDGVSSRHNFSPKLLASINNLKLANSPLGVISSAGYKNGNYFKFPEIDNVVNESMGGVETAHEVASQYYETQNRGGGIATMGFISSNIDRVQPVIESKAGLEIACSKDKSITMSTRKNRKNKNNLTIQITDSPIVALNPSVHSPSPTSSSPKPKTPTIKTTKEKALSLDSAPCETGLSIVIQSGESQTHVSCDEIDSKMHFASGGGSGSGSGSSKNNNNSNNKNNNSNNSSNNNNANNQQRQRNIGSRERLRPAISSSSSKSSASSSPAVYRTPHKPSPLLHSSNTNLKTLPEFLTLVEFSMSSPKERELCAFKQKSMDLPSTTTPNIRSKNIGSPSGSLLQRRGSNHSLTLNLHGSCGNLLGSCRGLSLSNYSLGSTAANSTTNLCVKSGRLGTETSSNTLQPNVHLTTQGAKQSLFRRRGSNQSFTLKNSATSCGNLNALVSQNSLNVDRNVMHVPGIGGGGGVGVGGGFVGLGGCSGGIGGGVTRTTSFITPTTHNSMTPKRGLLERRGSNQSLTLNMSSSVSGGGTDRNACLGDESFQRRYDKLEPPNRGLLPQYCAQHHRKFFSSENLNKQHTQAIDMNSQTERRPFGSASDLKASGSPIRNASNANAGHTDLAGNAQESNICTCSGMRNIMTRPLSPQRKAEEFKTYLANIQTLQNASNVLKQHDLIKLNYIFDNSYASSRKSLQGVLPPIVLGVEPSSANGTKDTGTPQGIQAGSGSLAITSEDSEITSRYEEVAKPVLDSLQIDVTEQKRIFCELHKEFWDLPLNHQEKPLVFGSQAKNRYKTILPNETTRVMLQQECMEFKYLGINTKGSEEEGAEKSEKISSYGTGNKLLIASAETPYINANYIKGPDATNFSYVATQGPLPNTIFEFWLMVFQNVRKNDHHTNMESNRIRMQYYQKLVMLTNFQEHHRQKCVVYFPVELNEIFIATSKQEVLPRNDILNAFFDKYLRSNESYESHSCNESEPFMEHFIEQEVNETVNANLPQTGNCFVIKNVGIVRKSGFSIRKMIVLYCMIQAQSQAQAQAQSIGNADENLPRLCIQRFCCYHYWYPDWPDHRSPRDINTLVDICIHILNLGKCEAEFDDCSQPDYIANHQMSIESSYQQDLFNTLQPLPIIHCSAGVGRTGCLTAILNGIRQMRQALAYSLTSMAADMNNERNIKSTQPPPPPSPIDFRLPKEYYELIANDDSDTNIFCTSDTDSSFTRNTLLYIKYITQQHRGGASSSSRALNVLPSLTELPRMPDINVDILGIVCNLRLSRGGMVQNSEQYELIHRALCLYMKRTLALKRF